MPAGVGFYSPDVIEGPWFDNTVAIGGFFDHDVLESIDSTPKAGTDSGTGADASVLTVLLVPTDTGTGADNSALVAVYGTTDTGAGTEASNVSQIVTDTGTGADASSLV